MSAAAEAPPPSSVEAPSQASSGGIETGGISPETAQAISGLEQAAANPNGNPSQELASFAVGPNSPEQPQQITGQNSTEQQANDMARQVFGMENSSTAPQQGEGQQQQVTPAENGGMSVVEQPNASLEKTALQTAATSQESQTPAQPGLEASQTPHTETQLPGVQVDTFQPANQSATEANAGIPGVQAEATTEGTSGQTPVLAEGQQQSAQAPQESGKVLPTGANLETPSATTPPSPEVSATTPQDSEEKTMQEIDNALATRPLPTTENPIDPASGNNETTGPQQPVAFTEQGVVAADANTNTRLAEGAVANTEEFPAVKFEDTNRSETSNNETQDSSAQNNSEQSIDKAYPEEQRQKDYEKSYKDHAKQYDTDHPEPPGDPNSVEHKAWEMDRKNTVERSAQADVETKKIEIENKLKEQQGEKKENKQEKEKENEIDPKEIEKEYKALLKEDALRLRDEIREIRKNKKDLTDEDRAKLEEKFKLLQERKNQLDKLGKSETSAWIDALIVVAAGMGIAVGALSKGTH